MVKFKMKIILMLCVIASLTITLTVILYMGSDSHFGISEASNNYFVSAANSIENDDDFLRTRLVRNPISPNYNVRGSKELVYTNLSNSFKLILSNTSSTNYVLGKRMDVFKLRRDVMLSECSKINVSGKLKLETLGHILVDNKSKLLFCYVPKVACTNWKRMLLLLGEKYHNYTQVLKLPADRVHARNIFPSLQNYSQDDVDYFIKNYRKVIFVRNPLERLLSAYINKFEQRYNSSKYFQSRFGKFIVKNFRVHPANQSLLNGDDVTFTEFITYLVSSNQDSYNEHWQQINTLCQPCSIQYDIVGKYETLVEDSNAILKLLGFQHPFPTLAKPSKTASSLALYYGQLPEELLKRLYDIYETDFRLFRYGISTVSEYNKISE